MSGWSRSSSIPAFDESEGGGGSLGGDTLVDLC